MNSSTTSSPSSPSSSSSPSIFPPIPAPLQRLFDLVPLVTYPANALPGDNSSDDGFKALPDTDTDHLDHLDHLSTLYVFIDPADAVRGRASFNPTCLKWQTFLRIADIPFRTVASSNHASPTGALPFLQPARNRATTAAPIATTTARPLPPRPIPASDLSTWVAKTVTSPSTPPSTLRDHPRAAAYQALLDTSLRRAWLHAVYLDEPRDRQSNKGASIAVRLYAHTASTSFLVRAALASQLRAAAAAEVWGSQQHNMSRGTPAATAQIYRDAETALSALATVLGGDNYFFGSAEPTLFDAAVFSYTHLLLEDGDDNDEASRFPWHNRILPNMVRGHPQLVQHRSRIVENYWTKEA
ncbi:hypothetical protein SEPCBS57363_005970 [Sporothrix epigloea]|uniref:Mitochondrial outer membrane protein n=1 Tax=Sporothrix epigloea TaxID=1892477 RepID=A0ABP0E3X4_9PEZI